MAGLAVAPGAAQATGRVYRATCPLEGFEPLVEGLLGQGYPPPLALHHFVVVEALLGDDNSSSSSSRSSGSGNSSSSSSVWAFDFLPTDPLSPLTAAALLTGGDVPGVVRRRQLRGVPRLRCELCGDTALADPLAAAEAFQRRFNTRLRLLTNDCTHFAGQLCAHLLTD